MNSRRPVNCRWALLRSIGHNMPIEPTDIPALLKMLRDGTAHLTAMAKSMEVPWDPTIADPKRLHNMYARNLICAYVSKFSDLSMSILHAVEHDDFLTYALCGRALLESTATLRYYAYHRYKPLLDKGSFDAKGFQELIAIDDQHLRGGRFDWDSFLFRRYSKLKADAIADLAARKAKKKSKPATTSETVTTQQVNVRTCMDKWGEATPEVLITYDLFCDLVHPNIGSTFLVASTAEGKLYFSRFRGEPVGRQIFAQSFPILLSATHKPFGEYLLMLIGTIWQDDEL
jgi:hypothetical protein